jgi:hypothetical protein
MSKREEQSEKRRSEVVDAKDDAKDEVEIREGEGNEMWFDGEW